MPDIPAGGGAYPFREQVPETPNHETFPLYSSNLPQRRCCSISQRHISRTCRISLLEVVLIRFGNKFPKHRQTFPLYSSNLPLRRCSSISQRHISRTCRISLLEVVLIRFGNKFPKHRLYKRSRYIVVTCPNVDVLPFHNVILAALAGYPCWRWRLSVSGTSSRNTEHRSALRISSHTISRTVALLSKGNHSCRCSSISQRHLSRTCRISLLEVVLIRFGNKFPKHRQTFPLYSSNLPQRRCSSISQRHISRTCRISLLEVVLIRFGNKFPKHRKTSSRNTETCPYVDVLPFHNVILAALAGYPCWRWCLSVSGTSSRNTESGNPIRHRIYEQEDLAALAGYPCWRWRLSVSGTSSRNTDTENPFGTRTMSWKTKDSS